MNKVKCEYLEKNRLIEINYKENYYGGVWLKNTKERMVCLLGKSLNFELGNMNMKIHIARVICSVVLATTLACSVVFAETTAGEIEEWRVAAEQGHADAQFNLGFAYFRGKGVAQDKNEAVH